MATIIEQIKERGQSALGEVYMLYRREFLNWASKQFNVNTDDAKDAYQQAIIIFYENVMGGKLENLQSSEKTYLFAIGKNKLRENLRMLSKHDDIDELDWQEEQNEELATPEQTALALSSLKLLGEPCQSLLEQFYFHRSSMNSIVLQFGYKNEDTAKSQKYKCLTRLRKIFSEQSKLAS